MILGDLVTYLKSYSALTALLPAAKIFPLQAPTGEAMPFLIVEVSEGTRGKIAAQLTEGRPLVRVTINGGAGQTVSAGNIADKAQKALENFRGIMGTMNDVFIECSEIRSWPGMSGTCRYQFNANIKYTQTRQIP